MSKSQSLELFYINGYPDGMVTAELYNWTGHVLKTPRTRLAEALQRPESGYTGLYLLLGEADGDYRAYIGEGENIAKRISLHDMNKQWWDSAVLITTAANKLNKAHIRYLEARLIAEAKEINHTLLDNNVSPSLPSLSEADISKMEMFLQNLLIVLPAVRVDIFIKRTRSLVAEDIPASVLASPRSNELGLGEGFYLEIKKENFRAEAVLNDDGEFIVLVGSHARPLQNAGTYKKLYQELQRSGVIAQGADGQLRFVKSYAFKSPSAAASVATGRSTNGTWEWKNLRTGQPYKEWEADYVKASVDAFRPFPR